MKIAEAYVKILGFLFLMFTITDGRSGGNFTILRSVTGGGGGQSAGGTFTLDGTSGQPTGSTSSGGTFQVGGGFWGGSAAPVANISISGRIFTSDGITGLRNATVSLTDSIGAVRSVTTSSFGFYSFENVPPGFSYTIRILSRRFRYQPQTVVPTGDLTGVNFVGLE